MRWSRVLSNRAVSVRRHRGRDATPRSRLRRRDNPSWRRPRSGSLVGPPRRMGRDVLVGVEIVIVRVIVEPLVVAHVAVDTTMDRSAEPAHPLVDREGRVLADIGDDGRLPRAEYPRRLVARFIARV